MIPGVPLRRGFRVTLSLRSGAAVRFTCDDFVLRQKPAEFVLGLEAMRSRDFPDFICLADVDAMTSRRVLRLRPLLWMDPAAWCTAGALWGLLRLTGLLP